MTDDSPSVRPLVGEIRTDAEHADLEKERGELRDFPDSEHRELVGIYVRRGLEPALAEQVATQLAAHDALGAHARDELGITEILRARRPATASSSGASGCRSAAA